MIRSKMMAGLIGGCAVFLVAAPAWSAEWMTDYNKAMELAKKTDKPVLIDFTGSDWCGWCIKLKNEVFDKAEFKDWAEKNVVLLEVDMPRKTQLPEALHRQNEGLREKFNIRGFPTIVFVGPEGQEIGRSGYLPGGPEKWLANANQIIASASPKLEVFSSLAPALAKAGQAGRPLLMIVDPNCDDNVNKLLGDRRLVRFASRRLVVVHLEGALSEGETRAYGEFRTKCGIKGEPASIALIDPAQSKLLMSMASVPDAEKLLADLRKSLPRLTYDGLWLEDYQRAENIAEELNRPMLLDFTGSDWCGWCVRLDKEIFATQAFRDYARDNLVLVKLDFPKQRELPEQVKAQNDALARKYGIRGFPTVVVLSPGGDRIGQMGYMAGGPDAFLPKLKDIIENWRKDRKDGVNVRVNIGI